MKQVTLIILLSIISLCQAQEGVDIRYKKKIPEMASKVNEASKKVLYVELVQALEQKKKHDETIEEHNNNVEKLNEKLKKYFTTYWKANQSIVFEEPEDVAYAKVSFSALRLHGKKAFHSDESGFAIVNLHSDDGSDWKNLLFKVVIAKNPTKIDLIYAIRHLNNLCLFYNSEKNIEDMLATKITAGDRIAYSHYAYHNSDSLKNKILLISENDQLVKHLTEEEISSYYPYPFKLVTPDVIEEAILSNDERYAYIQIAPYNSSGPYIFGQHVVLTQDGRLAGFSRWRTAGIVTPGVKINLPNFQDYTKKY